MNARRIYIIGYMAAGKSWLGRELAASTGITCTDMDELFEERYRVSVLDFFRKYGEPLFRKLEREILIGTAATDNLIIVTGGGTPCFSDNMDFILRSGTSVYLRMPLTELIRRIRGIRKKRPLLKDVPPADLQRFVCDQLATREIFYSRADFIFDGPDYPVGEIIGALGLRR